MNLKTYFRLGAAPAALGLALLASPATAQDAAPQDATAPIAGPAEAQPPVAATDPSATSPSDVVVTGSRIPQPNLEGTSPVTVVNSQDFKLQGVTRTEDLLNSLPQVFAGQSSTLSNGADGTATVDLRGLGPTRTLVLINGRRLLPGDPQTSAADLNAIPSSLVKRVEVLTGGASSTYGADAVAGVVNFIMDTDFKGIKLDGQYSLYQHDNRNKILPPLLDARTKAGFDGFGYPQGNVADGGTVDATLTVGAGIDDDRGHITAYVGYRKVNAVTQDRRDYSACTIQNASATALQCGGSATAVPGNVFLYDSDTGNTSSSTAYTFTPGGGFVNGLTRYNFAPTNYFQRPDERYTAGLFANYEVSEAVKPYAEFMFMDDRSLAQIAPSGNFGNTLSVNCDNPLLSAAQSAVVCDTENLVNGTLGTFPLTSFTNPGVAPTNFIDPTTGATYNRGFFQLLRRNVEGGPRIADLQHTQYRAVIGSKGNLGPAFTYDVYYQYGRTNYAQTYRNEFSTRKLTRALDVVQGPNGPICRSVRDGTDPACVPYDVFNLNVTPEAVAYLSTPGFQRGEVTEQVASGSITGQLGQYGITSPFASEGIGFNIGVEYRKESLNLETDEAFRTGDLTGQGAPTLPINGNYHVIEGFGEVQVPLVRENFIYDLSFNGGYRYSRYSISNGREFSTNTYKLGLEFAPIRDIRFRGTYNRAVRAPNLQELFATPFVGLDGSTDPCAGFTITAADVGCLAQGLRVGQRVTPNPAGQYNGLLGGNQNLNPERATTKSVGVILQPQFLPRFAVTVDYYDIKVARAIQGFGADAILASCTTTVNPTACALINRNPVNGSLWLTPDGYVNDLQTNVGGVSTAGIDVNASYSTPTFSWGSLSANLIGTYLDKYEIDNGLTEPYDCVGLYGVTCSALTTTPSAPTPRWRHKSRLSYASPDGIGLSLQWRYFGPVRVDYTSDNPSLAGDPYAFGRRLGAQSYFDLAATFAIEKNYVFRLGVNNLLDREPPLVTSGNAAATGSACPTGACNGNTYPAVYDALGRYLYAGFTLQF